MTQSKPLTGNRSLLFVLLLSTVIAVSRWGAIQSPSGDWFALWITTKNHRDGQSKALNSLEGVSENSPSARYPFDSARVAAE
jgi:hypothetical protein